VTPEAGKFIEKAHDCLRRARIILDAGVGEDAGRDAYLAAFHAAQAFIHARSGRAVKTHRGVQTRFSMLVLNEPRLMEFQRFLSQAYNLKSVADYDLGPGADVPLDQAKAAIDTAARFIDRIIELLDT
jgi:uncharacterized protein (UPF0332 family)